MKTYPCNGGQKLLGSGGNVKPAQNMELSLPQRLSKDINQARSVPMLCGQNTSVYCGVYDKLQL